MVVVSVLGISTLASISYFGYGLTAMVAGLELHSVG